MTSSSSFARRCARLSRVGALGFVVALSACPALAQTNEAPFGRGPRTHSSSTDSEAAVKELLLLGASEYRKGHLEAARDAFARAFASKQHVAIAATLAEVETKLGQYRAAANHWSFYLEHLPAEHEDERGEVEATLAECRKHLGVIAIRVDAKDAKLFLDGDALGTLPREGSIWVDPGEHVLVAEGEIQSDHVTVSLTAGESKTVALHVLEPAPTPGVRPVTPVRAEPGTPDTTKAVSPRSSSASGLSPRATVLIAGGAATLAAAIVGTTFVVRANTASSSADEIQAELDTAAAGQMVPADAVCAPSNPARPVGCSDLAGRRHDVRRDKNIAIASFITAGGLAVATVGAYLLWPTPRHAASSSNRPRIALAPWFTRTGAGVALSFTGDFVLADP
jgi:hypothetical protein